MLIVAKVVDVSRDKHVNKGAEREPTIGTGPLIIITHVLNRNKAVVLKDQ